MTVFNPVILKSLDSAVQLNRADCVWGHHLVELAEQLAARRRDFNLSAEMHVSECRSLLMPMSLRQGFALFDSFYSDLCHPRELEKLGRAGEDEKFVLDVLVSRLQALLSRAGP